jgi:hypothetical protein
MDIILMNYFETWERLAVSGADERLVAVSIASDKVCFREELPKISHVFLGNSTKIPLYEGF